MLLRSGTIVSENKKTAKVAKAKPIQKQTTTKRKPTRTKQKPEPTRTTTKKPKQKAKKTPKRKTKQKQKQTTTNENEDENKEKEAPEESKIKGDTWNGMAVRPATRSAGWAAEAKKLNRSKLPRNCLLRPEDEKYPVCLQKGQLDCRGVLAAKQRARMLGHTKIFKKASVLAQQYCKVTGVV